MKKNLFIIVSLSLGVCLSACRSLQSADKGTEAAASGSVGIAASAGRLIGNDGKSALIGTKGAMAADAGVRAAIGVRMDRVAAAVAVIDGVSVDSFTDFNGLKALRVTLGADRLFDRVPTAFLTEEAKVSLGGLAGVLLANPDIRLMIFGHTDNVGTLDGNRRVSQVQADAVVRFLLAQGVPVAQIDEVGGRGFADPIAGNDTAAGQAQNRRVDIYMYAGPEMLKP